MAHACHQPAKKSKTCLIKLTRKAMEGGGSGGRWGKARVCGCVCHVGLRFFLLPFLLVPCHVAMQLRCTHAMHACKSTQGTHTKMPKKCQTGKGCRRQEEGGRGSGKGVGGWGRKGGEKSVGGGSRVHAIVPSRTVQLSTTLSHKSPAHRPPWTHTQWQETKGRHKSTRFRHVPPPTKPNKRQTVACSEQHHHHHALQCGSDQRARHAARATPRVRAVVHAAPAPVEPAVAAQKDIAEMACYSRARRRCCNV